MKLVFRHNGIAFTLFAKVLDKFRTDGKLPIDVKIHMSTTTRGPCFQGEIGVSQYLGLNEHDSQLEALRAAISFVDDREQDHVLTKKRWQKLEELRQYTETLADLFETRFPQTILK
jgi:hypothetical protein